MRLQPVHATEGPRPQRVRTLWVVVLAGLAATVLIPDANTQSDINAKQSQQQSFEAANTERKKQIEEDSARLLKLATELKAEVDKTNKDTLSLTVIRKADEIEKLAHNVKEKMKLTVGAS